jgi:hypothetical protein
MSSYFDYSMELFKHQITNSAKFVEQNRGKFYFCEPCLDPQEYELYRPGPFFLYSAAILNFAWIGIHQSLYHSAQY